VLLVQIPLNVRLNSLPFQYAQPQEHVSLLQAILSAPASLQILQY
jgi:hypothetical protein